VALICQVPGKKYRLLWDVTTAGPPRSHSSTISNLIGPAQSGFPMSWFFPTPTTTCVLVNSTRPQNLPFSVFFGSCPKWQNHTSSHKSEERFGIGNPKFLFAFHSNHRSISLSFGDICDSACDRQTDRQMDNMDHFYG